MHVVEVPQHRPAAGTVGSAVVTPALVGAPIGAVGAVAPWVALARGPRALGAAGVAGQLLARADVEPVVPAPRRFWPTLPLGVVVVCLVSLRSSLDRLRGGVEWRGRRYGGR